MTTLRDVARAAGVSVAAASYALNGNGTIADETRQRVLAVAEELNYHPNAFARHLKKIKTRTIGVFITRFGGSFYEEILEGIHDAVLSTDYELIVCPESRPAHRILMYRQVDGAIVFDTKISSEVIGRLAAPSFPIVVLDRASRQDFVFPLLLDNRQGVREAFHHLHRQGLRRLAFVAGAPDSLDNAERKQAFLDEARQHGLAVQLCQGNFTEASGYAAAQELLATADRAEGVFCANDQMAIGLLRAMHERGLRAPEDIAVIGFDDIQVAALMRPSLSTVGASRVAWGATAARQLIGFLEDRTPIQSQRIPTHLIARQSSCRATDQAPNQGNRG